MAVKFNTNSAVNLLLASLLLWLAVTSRTVAAAGEDASAIGGGGTIGFATLGRLHYDFDVYTLKLPPDVLHVQWPLAELPTTGGVGGELYKETRVTYGDSVSYNAQLVEVSSVGPAVLERLKTSGQALEVGVPGLDGLDILVYVSEVEGSAQVYIDIPLGATSLQDVGEGLLATKKDQRVALHTLKAPPTAYLNDKPSMVGETVVYVSTEDDVGKPRQGWNGIYSTSFRNSVTKRLSPQGVTDYSPSVSPSGEWVAVASNEGRGWEGEFEALNLDLYVFKTEDGSQRRLVVKNGGWPTWADEVTVYFHRLADDGWWSIFKVNISDTFSVQEAERVTPSGVHAFTPAASRSGKWIAVATRRSSIRHIEIFDLQGKKFLPVTELINPNAHHYSPFVSTSSGKLGYHRCRGSDQDGESSHKPDPHVEYVTSPLQKVSLTRIDGSFPTFSPDGSLIAYVDPLSARGHLNVMKLDGSGKRKVHEGFVHGTAWDPTGKGIVYVAQGPIFASEKTSVHILAITNADTADLDADKTSSSYKYLTKEGTENNAFPSPSPDGKYIVFRSGRSGHKNLYIMDADGGEEKYLRRLTEGNWGDTMPAWSPDNEWIAFVSNRQNPSDERSHALYLIRPNGTDLHMVLSSGEGGHINHPVFSPDGASIVFTTDYAGVSAEPISLPHAFQPYGEIFVIQTDGSGLTRVTHNVYEDGTPTWGRLYISKSGISNEGERATCTFDDVEFLKNARTSPRHTCGFDKDVR